MPSGVFDFIGISKQSSFIMGMKMQCVSCKCSIAFVKLTSPDVPILHCHRQHVVRKGQYVVDFQANAVDPDHPEINWKFVSFVHAKVNVNGKETNLHLWKWMLPDVQVGATAIAITLVIRTDAIIIMWIWIRVVVGWEEINKNLLGAFFINYTLTTVHTHATTITWKFKRFV